MKKIFLSFFIFLFIGINTVNGATLTISPKTEVLQGEPVLIQISGVKLSDINKLTFGTKKLDILTYKNKLSAFYGIDLNQKAGEYNIVLTLKNGSTTTEVLKVKERPKRDESMPIPETSGGNSPENQTRFVSKLVDEGALLNSVKTGLKAFWTKPFIYPIANPIVTDIYGYQRLTGLYTIPHKGTDFRAKEGTPVLSMNRGVVRMARRLETYGNTIIVDHGFGLMTFYMHLSKIRVNVGELVQQGQVIGLSGSTGYSTAPHLHITVRLNNVSIDPLKFLEFFK